MIPLNALIGLAVLIITLLVISSLSRRFGFQKVTESIGLISVLLSLLFFSFFTISILYPLEMRRLVTGDKSIPTSSEISASFAQVKKALTPLATQGYVSKSSVPAAVDNSVGITIPEKCGYYIEELSALNDQSAANEISKIVVSLNASDEDLLRTFRALSEKHQMECRTGGLNALGATSEAAIASSIKKCLLKKLYYFDTYAGNAKKTLFSLLNNKELFQEVSMVFDKQSSDLNSEDAVHIVEYLYHPDNKLRDFAKQLLNKLDSRSDDNLLAHLNSNNPFIVSTIIQSFQIRDSKDPSVINAMRNLAENSLFNNISTEAFSAYLLMTSSLDQKREERLNLSLKVLSKEDSSNITQYLDALTKYPVADLALVNKLQELFFSRENLEIQIRIIQVLGSVGEISSTVLSKIAYETFYKPSDTLFRNSGGIRRFLERAASGDCKIVASEKSNNNSGVPYSWELSPWCKTKEPIDSHNRVNLSSCDDPANHSKLSIALKDAISKVGKPAVEPLLKHLNSSNPIYKAIAYHGIINTINNDKSFIGEIPNTDLEKQHLWNQVYIIKIAGHKDEKAAKDLLPILIKNKMFSECMKNHNFSSHYLSLGREILE